MVSSIRTSKLVASIGETSREEAPLILASEFRGGFQGQELTWEALDGQIRFRHHEPWNLTSLIGSASQSGIKISKGTATGPGEASIDVVMVNQEADGQVLLAVEGKNLPVAGQYINEQDNPLINLVVNASGQFHSEDLNFDTYLFTGRAEFTGIELGRLPLFQLLANQTGEDGFRAMSDAKATAEIEWEPGLLILKQLKFEEPGLLRLNGNLEAMETGLRGNLELALPAVIAGRFPGGKPSGFSYPAGGWSRAMVTVTGRPHQWNEDLTERLLAQVSTDLAISPLVLSEAHPIASDSKAEDFQRKLTREQAETYERYFDLMLDTRASEPLSQ